MNFSSHLCYMGTVLPNDCLFRHSSPVMLDEACGCRPRSRGIISSGKPHGTKYYTGMPYSPSQLPGHRLIIKKEMSLHTGDRSTSTFWALSKKKSAGQNRAVQLFFRFWLYSHQQSGFKPSHGSLVRSGVAVLVPGDHGAQGPEDSVIVHERTAKPEAFYLQRAKNKWSEGSLGHASLCESLESLDRVTRFRPCCD